MRVPDVNPLAENLAIAAGLGFMAIPITWQLMRKRANQQVLREHRISWFIAGPMRKLIVDDYRRLYPQGWEYRALQTFQVLWLTSVILAFLALFLGSST